MQAPMQLLAGKARKAMQLYNMVADGDKICIGVSGGKDSMALAMALASLARYYEKKFTVHAVTLDPFFGGTAGNFAAVQAVFAKNGIPYTIHPTNIGEVVFDIRKESNPCALCANLRRGILHTQATALGCNKVALGHHLDDVVETFFMNLFGKGHMGCFAPKTYLSRCKLTMIRPLVLLTESEVIRAVQAENLPIVKSMCPAEGLTQRSATKLFVTEQSQKDPAFRQKILGALQKSGLDGWGTAL